LPIVDCRLSITKHYGGTETRRCKALLAEARSEIWVLLVKADSSVRMREPGREKRAAWFFAHPCLGMTVLL
jgi:hypothetical protein